ncbi:MAG: glutamate-5-semialdehyde dehydrogenase, partial [Candidatus Rokuibacteriota bacterium]
MDVRGLVEAKARAASRAARALALSPTRVRNEALAQMARGLEEKTAALLEANRTDLETARTGGAARAFLDRLTLTEDRVAEMAAGLRQIGALPDPVGETVETWRRPNGIEIARVRVPLGVIGFIYESRPNVTADAAGLCVKSGNAVLLRGGSEAIESNGLIAAVLSKALEKAGAPPDAIQFVELVDRAAVTAMLELDDLLDLVIPRGGEEFVRWVARHSRVPVLKHDKGLVHVFVDAAADLDMAARITVNAKAHRPSVCNALETLLVDRAVAAAFVPMVVARLGEAGVEVRGCPATRALAPAVRAATDADWDAEY